jgi:tRNA modification GTPase
VDVSTTTPLIAHVLTPLGRGAVATIQVSGDENSLASTFDRYFKSANGKALIDQPLHRICFGNWQSLGGALGDQEEVVVCRTSSSRIEVNCHGGQVAIDRILQMLAADGAELASNESGIVPKSHASFLESECYQALSCATTRRAVEFLLPQLPDRLEVVVEELLAELQDERSSSALEPTNNLTRIEKLDSILQWAEFGRHLTQPWRVVLIGRPNVGKSTLINALLGYDRAIVYDQPGTTRDVVVGDTAFAGWPVQIADTAGIRETTNTLESQGIQKSQQEIATADCVCVLLDSSTQLDASELALLEQAAVADDSGVNRLLVVLHKSDLGTCWTVEDLPPRFRDRCVSVSSTKRIGVDELIDRIVQVLVPKVPQDEAIIPLTNRQIDCMTKTRQALQIIPADESSAIRALIELLHR